MHELLKQEHDELHELNERFTRGDSLMTIAEFESEREQIEKKFEALAREALIVAPVAAEVAAANASNFYKARAHEVAAEVAKFCKRFAAEKTAPLKERIRELEATGGKFKIPIFDGGKMVGSQSMTAAELVREVSALRAGNPSQPLLERNRELEQRVAALEQKTGGVIYRGIWRQFEYRANDSVTHAGSFWICIRASTTATPGKSGDWKLASKNDIS